MGGISTAAGEKVLKAFLLFYGRCIVIFYRLHRDFVKIGKQGLLIRWL